MKILPPKSKNKYKSGIDNIGSGQKNKQTN